MAIQKLLVKNFSQFQGVDYESSDLIRGPNFASDMSNVDFSGNQALVKRKGTQAIMGDVGGYGITVYEDVDVDTGAVTETIITCDDSLRKMVDDSFNITYSGSNISLLNIGLNTTTNTFNLTISENGTDILDQDLGIGQDEAAATTVATVISAIDALADYAASGGTITTGSAAFLNLKDDIQLTSSATNVAFRRWVEISEAKANPLATSLTYKNNLDYENPCFVNMQNVLYVSTGYDYLHKYDGQTFYRAGLPAGGDIDGSGDVGTAPTLSESGDAGSIADGAYYYKYTYIQVDNKGNIIEGIPSPADTVTAAAGSSGLRVTPAHLPSSSGFNTKCAIINGAQSSTTTLTVDSGHTLVAGDTAYFYDSVSSDYVTRVITSVTATTIVWAATTSVTVADNAVISNNLRIAVYRTVVGAASTSIYYLVAEIPNDSISGTPAYYLDTLADASLGVEYIDPIKPHGLPPKCKYAISHISQLILAGDIVNVNKVYYSDIDSPEYFPAGDNSFLVDAFNGSKIYGIATLDANLYVFKNRSIQAVSGDIAEDAFRVDEVSYGQVGCAAHHSIQQVNGKLMFLSKFGVFSVDSQGVVPIGAKIVRKFTKFDVDSNLQKATSCVWADRSKYLLFVPTEAQDGSSNYYATSASELFCYDYSVDAWLPWTGINAQGGIIFGNNDLYCMARRIDGNSSTVKKATYIFNDYGTSQDYSDHNAAISFSYSTHWEFLGEPNILKRFSRLKVFALPNDMVEGEVPLCQITVGQEFNFISPAISNEFNIDFSGGTTGYGNGPWGTFPWGDSALSEIKSKLKTTKARSMRLTFSNDTALENVLISGFELECIPTYAPQMKE